MIPRLRDALAELGAAAVPGFATLPGAFQAFNDDGTLKDEKAAGMLKGLAERVVAALDLEKWLEFFFNYCLREE